jgi:hypothetical protein
MRQLLPRGAIVTSVAAGVTTLLLLTGCAAGASDESGAASASPAAGSSVSTPSPAAVKVPIRILGGQVTPSGSLVHAEVGQPIDLVVTTDAASEIHVHSNPEHEYEVPAGAHQAIFEFTIDQPGEVDVESHTLDTLIVKLQVS